MSPLNMGSKPGTPPQSRGEGPNKRRAKGKAAASAQAKAINAVAGKGSY